MFLRSTTFQNTTQISFSIYAKMNFKWAGIRFTIEVYTSKHLLESFVSNRNT